MKSIDLKSICKINIGLNVVNKREDGFHDLETFFYPIFPLYDEIKFVKHPRFEFSCDNEELNNPSNLVVKAVKLLEKVTGVDFKVKIELHKNIPTGAGLGGGSSNAASTLLCLNELYDLKIERGKMIKYALEIGSDVPFFIRARPSIGRSRGEILEEADVHFNLPFLIVNPGIHIPTGEAFGNISPQKSDFDYSYFRTIKEIDFNFLRVRLRNDFEPYIFGKHPEIRVIKERMYEAGALLAMMTGTGSTVFGIFDKIEKAEEASESLPANYFKFSAIC